VCIQDLHLVALGNLCDWGFLVTLGDCHHLHCLVDYDSVRSTREDCAVLRRRICEGYGVHPVGITKSNSSGLLVAWRIPILRVDVRHPLRVWLWIAN